MKNTHLCCCCVVIVTVDRWQLWKLQPIELSGKFSNPGWGFESRSLLPHVHVPLGKALYPG